MLSLWSFNLAAQPQRAEIFSGTRQFQGAQPGFITTLSTAPSTQGDYFLNSEWLRGIIVLKDSSAINDIHFKLNLKDNWLEIKAKSDVRILPAARVLFFVWNNNYSAYNGTYWNMEALKLQEGFMKVIAENSGYYLLNSTGFQFIKASYNVALDAGRKDHQIIKTNSYFIYKKDQLLQVDINRKRFLKELATFTGKDCIERFENSKLNLRRESDLIKVIEKL